MSLFMFHFICECVVFAALAVWLIILTYRFNDLDFRTKAHEAKRYWDEELKEN